MLTSLFIFYKRRDVLRASLCDALINMISYMISLQYSSSTWLSECEYALASFLLLEEITVLI